MEVSMGSFLRVRYMSCSGLDEIQNNLARMFTIMSRCVTHKTHVFRFEVKVGF